MKSLSFHLSIFSFLLLLMGSTNIYSQSAINGMYVLPYGRTIYLIDGDMYFYRTQDDHILERQEHYPYKYQNREIVFKYTGQIKLNYKGNQVESLTYLDGKTPLKRIATMAALLEHRPYIKNDDVYQRVVQTEPRMSRAQFDEVIQSPDYLKHFNINVPLFSYDEIIIASYKKMKAAGQIKAADAAPKAAASKVVLGTDYKIKWSEIAGFKYDGANGSGNLVFCSNFFTGKKATLMDKYVGNGRAKGEDVEFKLAVEIIKDGKVLGSTDYDNRKKITVPRFCLANYGRWTEYSGHFKTGNSTTADRPYDDIVVATNTLRDGNYKIKMTVYEEGMQPRTRYFPFQMRNGKIIGDDSISAMQYKKAHGIRRLDSSYIFLRKE